MNTSPTHVLGLRQFYATALGDDVRVLVGGAIQKLWPRTSGDAMLAIGFATPYLDAYLSESAPLFVCMPAQQGACYWPPGASNHVFLSHESELPLPDNSINRVLLVHSVENSEQLSWMMQEVWRVLTPGGRMLAVVPNRTGLWSRSSRSPFGYGRPFSMAQLRDLVSGHYFTPTRSSSALFMPPVHIKPLMRIQHVVEKIGRFFCWFLGGVLLIEAEKQVYAAIKQPVTVRRFYRAAPVARPVMTQTKNL